jgi:hypothetical protein
MATRQRLAVNANEKKITFMIPIDHGNLRDCLIACLIAVGVWGLIQLFPGNAVVVSQAQQTLAVRVLPCAAGLARVGGCAASSDRYQRP